MIRCSTPLPEGLDNPVLEKMLELAPCPEPSKEDKGGNNEGESGPPLLPISTEGTSASVREDNRALVEKGSNVKHISAGLNLSRH